jgi:stage III sporulation protein SpoIIIAA
MSDLARRPAIDDLDALLAALPPEIAQAVRALPDTSELIEVVMDLGRPPEARFPDSEVTLLEREISEADIAYVVDHIGSFGDDNRAGIERTLHRISAIRNRNGKIVGLTCRIGRAVFGTIEIIEDLVESGKSILIMGRPGIGKTTMLREAARVLADQFGKRVVVVDTSNEIAGDGDIPHPAIGKARRMQVRTPSLQHEVMIEAVENHMPQVIVIDEIGTELEALAARTIAERGVQLIATAHGNTLDNLMLNPTLSDLIGGIQSVTLGDEEARRRRTQKSVLERKAPPTFDVVVEIVDRDRVIVHTDVAETVDAMLRGDPVAPEFRWRDEAGVHRSQARPRPSPRSQLGTERFAGLVGAGPSWRVEPGWRGETPYRLTTERSRGGNGGWRPNRERQVLLPPPAGPVAPSAPGEGGSAPTEAGVVTLRARELRELERQAAWRAGAARALAEARPSAPLTETGAEGEGAPAPEDLHGDDEAIADRELAEAAAEAGEALRVEPGVTLPTIRVLPFGISRKRLEQAIRELQLPVIVARDIDEADIVMTLRSEYRQKGSVLREAEERALPIYVLKANTVVQMEASLTSIFSLEVDPREAALREAQEAIGLVLERNEPVELSPQNAYIRRLQHQLAEEANLVSRSRGREPFRRVRLYPERVRPW